ncbi:MAG: adenylyl-sulfate kinase [Myxococcota bacterium]
MSETRKSANVVWSESLVGRAEREALLRHRAVTLWFTGLSGSGKSTLAVHVERALSSRGVLAYVLDGDNIRHGLSANLGFSAEDRRENIRRIGEVAKLLNDAGVIVLTAFISPYRSDRARVRETLPDGHFLEVFVDCPLEICERRDVKGLYQKARSGAIAEFTGISAPYEPPLAPELRVATAENPLEACVAQVLGLLEARSVIPRAP